MNRKISDILDTYDDPVLDLGFTSPLSAERIKAMTMKKIEQKSSSRKRILFRVLAAAAIIAAFSLTVLAYGNAAGWFRDFFGEITDGELSDGQIAFIDSNSESLHRSQTIEGYTVTLDSYISDGSKAYLKTVIHAPNGSNLAIQGIRFDEIDVLLENGDVACCSLTWDLEAYNEDMTSATYMLTLDFIILEDAVEGPNKLILKFTDLYDGPKWVRGSWNYEIDVSGDYAELLTKPVSGVPARSEGGLEFDVVVTSVCLRPMGIRLLYEAPVPENAYHHQIVGSVRVVMRDGTTAELLPGGYGRQSDGDTELLWAEYSGEILAIAEIDYLMLPGEIQIPVNAE